MTRRWADLCNDVGERGEVRAGYKHAFEGRATQLASASVVDGIAVGSAPDLMATKLEVIQHRRQGRDYIDIAAMDRVGACTIEDGLRYHKQRYAPTVTYEETLRIAQLAPSVCPEKLSSRSAKC